MDDSIFLRTSYLCPESQRKYYFLRPETKLYRAAYVI